MHLFALLHVCISFKVVITHKNTKRTANSAEMNIYTTYIRRKIRKANGESNFTNLIKFIRM